MQRAENQQINFTLTHFVTSNSALKMGIRKCPYAFTENGVAMLSGVLKSSRAIEVNIQIMRTFTKLRRLLAEHSDLRRRLEEIEKKFSRHDAQIHGIFEAIRKMITPPYKPKRAIGFKP